MGLNNKLVQIEPFGDLNSFYMNRIQKRVFTLYIQLKMKTIGERKFSEAGCAESESPHHTTQWNHNRWKILSEQY